MWFFFVFWFVFGYAIQEFYLLAGRVAVFDTNLHWGMCLYALILVKSHGFCKVGFKKGDCATEWCGAACVRGSS